MAITKTLESLALAGRPPLGLIGLATAAKPHALFRGELRYELGMPRLPFALPALLVMSGCVAPSAFATGQPATEQDYEPIGALQRGLELAGADVGMAAHFDMSVARQSALGPAIEAAVVADAGAGGDAVRSALHEAQRVWVFATSRPQDVVDTVFVLEGTAAEALRDYASALHSNQYPRTANGVTEYVVGHLQVAIRAPDTLVLGASHDRGGLQGAVYDWPDWADRLRGLSRAEPKAVLTATRDALGTADAPIWAVWRWTPALDPVVLGQLAQPTSSEREPLFSHVTTLGFAALPGDSGLSIRTIARASDADRATALAIALPRAMPGLEAFVPELATRVEGADVHATFTLSPEELAGLVAARVGG